MDVAQNRSLGFAGKEILFRKIEFERYRKPHVVEYPRSAIVLNPQHTRQLKDSLQNNRHRDNDADSAEGNSHHAGSDSENSDDDDDDPRRIDKTTQLCTDAQLRSSLHLRWQSIAPVGLGLVNLGNTCFANSVLQALAHVPALAQYFMATFRSADNQLGAPFDFAFALAETFRKMHPSSQPGRGGGGGAYRPGHIMGNLRLLSKHFSIGRQSDAHEFAVQLLFACQKSLLHRLMGSKKVQPRVAHTTALYRTCGGYLLSQVTWSRQEEIQQLLRAGKQQEAMDLKMEAKQALRQEQQTHRGARHGLDVNTLYSNTYDPFTILSVELAGHTLMHCLDKFCLAEELDGRCYHSPREVGVRAKKKFSIHVPPPVLIVHLKRFGPTGNKINKHVQFPLELNITRYCTPQPSPSSHKQAPPAGRAEEAREDCQYELNAICVHEGGSINYGHYYTMAKASNGMWYEFNDSHVSRLSEEQLQRAQAYMLCYSRVPSATKKKTAARPAAQSVPSRPSSAAGGVVLEAASKDGMGEGRELSEAEVEALLAKRRADASRRADAGAAVAPPGKKSLQDADDTRESTEEEEEGEEEAAPLPDASRVRNAKRVRESLPTDSDSDNDGDDQRDGAYVRRLRPAPGHRLNRDEGSQLAHGAVHTEDENNNNNDDDEDDDNDDDSGAEASAQTSHPSPTTRLSPYGGLIKSMKRVSNGRSAAAEGSGSGERTVARPNFRVGRHAVSELHARKVHDTPETVRRPMTAPKFQQRIRDPMWETEMDKGRVKKVKSKEKAPDPFEGTNPFQEVSRGMFDIRGRRRRD